MRCWRDMFDATDIRRSETMMPDSRAQKRVFSFARQCCFVYMLDT